MGIPLPAMGTAPAFYDGYRHARLPANLLLERLRARSVRAAAAPRSAVARSVGGP
jgi:hypothetical protein